MRWQSACFLLRAEAARAPGASGDEVASATGAPAETTSAKKKNVDPQQAGLDFARCMREHGVDMPDPGAGQGGFAVRIGGPPDASSAPTAAVSLDDNEAFQECRQFLDDAIASGEGPIDPEMADRALKFAQCMRDHGVNMPDPQIDGGSVSIMIGEGMDPDSPTLQAAHEACAELFGPPGGEGAELRQGVGGGPGLGVRGGQKS